MLLAYLLPTPPPNRSTVIDDAMQAKARLAVEQQLLFATLDQLPVGAFILSAPFGTIPVLKQNEGALGLHDHTASSSPCGQRRTSGQPACASEAAGPGRHGRAPLVYLPPPPPAASASTLTGGPSSATTSSACAPSCAARSSRRRNTI